MNLIFFPFWGKGGFFFDVLDYLRYLDEVEKHVFLKLLKVTTELY